MNCRSFSKSSPYFSNSECKLLTSIRCFNIETEAFSCYIVPQSTNSDKPNHSSSSGQYKQHIVMSNNISLGQLQPMFHYCAEAYNDTDINRTLWITQMNINPYTIYWIISFNINLNANTESVKISFNCILSKFWYTLHGSPPQY